MGILESFAKALGGVARQFDTARSADQAGFRKPEPREPRKPARRPAMLSSMAAADKWKGGDLAARDAAYRRAIQNSWIYQAVGFKAGSIASSRLYVAQDTGKVEGDATPIKAHPLMEIMRKPNPLMGRGYLWRYTHWWLDLAGNSYWFLAPDADGNLAEIWPLPANIVNPMPGDNNQMIAYYEYTPNGQYYRISPEYVCHFRYPNPLDYFRGLSPLVAAMLPADADSAMAAWNGAFFGADNVMPSAVVNLSSGSPETPIDPQDVEAVKEQLETEFAAGKRRTVVTGAFGMAVQLLGWNARDMDFLAGRTFSKDEIFGDLGLPPGMLDKNATEANATVMANAYKENTLWPLLCDIYADTITAQVLVPWYADDQVAAFEDIRPVNKAQLLQEATASAQDMTRKERRGRYWNLEPLGDERDNEIPGAQPTYGAQPAAPDAPFIGAPDGPYKAGLSNPLAGLPPAARSLPAEALADLRRWRRLALKALGTGKAPADIDFRSPHLPAPLRADLREALADAAAADQVRAVFDEVIQGSTKAAPQVGKPLLPGDDPFAPVKLVAEADLETMLLSYFAGLSARVLDQAAGAGITPPPTPEG